MIQDYLKNIKGIEPFSSSYAIGDYIKIEPLRIEDMLSNEQIKILESKWENRSKEVFDSDVIYLILKSDCEHMAAIGSYKIFYGINELHAQHKPENCVPYVLGSHAVIKTLDNYLVLFKKYDGTRVISGGVADTDDIIDGYLNIQKTALRETIEETGLGHNIITTKRTGIWLDKIKPHIFYTFTIEVGVRKNEIIFSKTALNDEGIDAYEYIKMSDVDIYQNTMSRSAFAACISSSIEGCHNLSIGEA